MKQGDLEAQKRAALWDAAEKACAGSEEAFLRGVAFGALTVQASAQALERNVKQVLNDRLWGKEQ